MNNILDSLLSSDAYTPVNKLIAQNIGFVTAGYFGELIRQRVRFGKNEFFFSQKNMESELGISKHQQMQALKQIKKLGFVSVTKKGVPCKNYFKIDDASVVEKLNHWQSKNGTTSSKEIEPQEVKKVDHSYNKNKNKNNINNINNKSDINSDEQSSINNGSVITLEKKEQETKKEISVVNQSKKGSAEIVKKPITNDINELIALLKQTCIDLGIAYDKTRERQFAKHIISAREFGEFCENIGQSRIQFAKNIVIASEKIGYWKGICAGPKSIYQNYADVYNTTKAKQTKTKNKEIGITSI